MAADDHQCLEVVAQRSTGKVADRIYGDFDFNLHLGMVYDFYDVARWQIGQRAAIV